MSSILNRRSLVEGSLAAMLGLVRPRFGSVHHDDSAGSRQVPAGAFNVKDFGAKGDGGADDAKAFQTAITAAGNVNGVVVVPASTTKYVIGSSLNVAPNTTIQGAGGQSPTVRLASGANTLFNFLGTREAEGLNVTLSNLTLESGSRGTGVAIRVRNFTGLFLRDVNINHFNLGLWADWGIGVYLYGCNFVLNKRGLQVGGVGGSGGIRGGARRADPFMDTVVVDACGFAQNELDINDMGSSLALGGIVIRNSSFFEAYANPVSGKSLYIRLANRKGITVYGNWFEGGQPSRTCVYLGNHDHDGSATGMCYGAAIFSNDFLQTGSSGTVGVDIARCEAATVFANCFEFAPGNSPVRLADTAGRNTIGQNAYLVYPDREGYVNPIAGSAVNNQILDPRLPARFGDELQVAGRVASGVTTLAYTNKISTDAAAANYFTIAVTDRNPFTIQEPARPIPGQQIIYEIRNSSGGAMGDITWGPAFQLAGPFMAPASRRRRTISFYYNGAAWIETARAAADI